MTNETLPEPEAFAATVDAKMAREGRKWAWLAAEVGENPQTLRNQLRNPHTLRLGLAKRIATALDISVWQYADAEAVAS